MVVRPKCFALFKDTCLGDDRSEKLQHPLGSIATILLEEEVDYGKSLREELLWSFPHSVFPNV